MYPGERRAPRAPTRREHPAHRQAPGPGIALSRPKNPTRKTEVPEMGTVITFVVRDGKIAEGREYFDDSAKADEFWV
ncbi:hypothetical protein NicSoilB4_35410 [Arthrobacter sp. NicSoilB4]|nr:hypothetical protein NicSoilB4_35410 [Arthrobacter sp. NicSoilB4]